MQTIPIAVSTDDPMLAAMLRLIGAAGLTIAVDAIERPAADEAERLLLSVELPSPMAAPGAVATGFDHDDDEAIDTHARAPELELQPPDPDATFRPMGAEEYGEARGEIDLQMSALSRLAEKQPLADVVRCLLRPLAARGWPIDGNREAVLTRLAEEFATYSHRHLAEAAARLLGGRHTHFPDQAEIYEAIGRAARPGASAQTRKAA